MQDLSYLIFVRPICFPTLERFCYLLYVYFYFVFSLCCLSLLIILLSRPPIKTSSLGCFTDHNYHWPDRDQTKTVLLYFYQQSLALWCLHVEHGQAKFRQMDRRKTFLLPNYLRRLILQAVNARTTNRKIKSGPNCWVLLQLSAAQTALAVIGNIAFPSGRNNGKIISSPFTGDEFTRSPPVAPRLPRSNVRNVFPRLSQTAPIELMFGGVWDKCTIIMWM